MSIEKLLLDDETEICIDNVLWDYAGFIHTPVPWQDEREGKFDRARNALRRRIAQLQEEARKLGQDQIIDTYRIPASNLPQAIKENEAKPKLTDLSAKEIPDKEPTMTHEHKCKFAKMFRAHLDPEGTHAYHECACGATRKNDEEWLASRTSERVPREELLK